MAELKPCPFCGGKASRGVGAMTPYYFEAQAHCECCGAEIRYRISVAYWYKNPEKEAKRQISRMWNRREDDGK